MLEKLTTSKEKILLFVFAFFLFVFLYVFFCNVHPVVPWDKDDWETMGYFFSYVKNGVPGLGMAAHFSCSFLGTISGYIAAFMIYPITGDYIDSIIIVGAFLRTISVMTVVFSIYYFLLSLFTNHDSAFWGTVFFLACSFAFFKIQDSSVYLYWTFNFCAIFYYIVPGCFSSAFALYLISLDINNICLDFNLKTGILLVILYFLMFSFFPAALLIAVVSFCILVFNCMQIKNIKSIIKKDWFYIVALLLFFIKFSFEFSRTFGSGYLRSPADFFVWLRSSFSFLQSTFISMNKIFLLVSLLIVCYAIYNYWSVSINKVSKEKICKNYMYVLKIFCISFVLCGLYFVLFGAVSLGHLSAFGVVTCRTDTLYVLYFLFLMLVTICLAFVLRRNYKLFTVVPVIVFILSSIAVNTAYSYSDSVYFDSTPQQRIEAVKKIVEEAKLKDLLGEKSFIVHLPEYSCNTGCCMGYSLYIHNITKSLLDIQFVFDENVETVADMYFE